LLNRTNVRVLHSIVSHQVSNTLKLTWF